MTEPTPKDSDHSEEKALCARYGMFSELNARWNNSKSSLTHNRLKHNPEEWCFYHTRLLEQEENWQIVPREQCAVQLKEILPRGSVVGDFGCGLGGLAEELEGWHLVHSYDHVALSPEIVECDISDVPLDDGCLDCVVFSLSLMGTNYLEYVGEAYRTLRLGGQMLIWHPARQSASENLEQEIRSHGFAIVEHREVYKWIHIWAIKQARSL